MSTRLEVISSAIFQLEPTLKGCEGFPTLVSLPGSLSKASSSVTAVSCSLQAISSSVCSEGYSCRGLRAGPQQREARFPRVSASSALIVFTSFVSLKSFEEEVGPINA